MYFNDLYVYVLSMKEEEESHGLHINEAIFVVQDTIFSLQVIENHYNRCYYL